MVIGGDFFVEDTNMLVYSVILKHMANSIEHFIHQIKTNTAFLLCSTLSILN